MTFAGTTSGSFPAATRSTMASSTAWKSATGTSEVVSVRYSGTAASIARSSASISCALSLIGPPDGEDDAIALVRLRERLVTRLQQRQGAEDGPGLLAAARAQLQARHDHDDLEVAAQGLVDERRRLADHPLEVVVRRGARLVGIDDDVHRARFVALGLLDDPAAERRRFLPGHVTQRIAARVLAEGMDVGAGARPRRRVLVALDGADALARDVLVEEVRVDDDVAADRHTPLFQKESERI